MEKGNYAGELPRKFINFHSLEKKSNEPKDSDTEGTKNYPDFPERSESEIVVFEETETSPTKSLTVLQVAGAKQSTVIQNEDTNEESVTIGSEECLILCSDEGSEGLEKLLRDKFDSPSGEGLERILEVNPTVVLKFLDEK